MARIGRQISRPAAEATHQITGDIQSRWGAGLGLGLTDVGRDGTAHQLRLAQLLAPVLARA